MANDPLHYEKERHEVFKCLHAVYHERDFRVRVNDYTIERVRRCLARAVGERKQTETCPACRAGFDPLDCEVTAKETPDEG